MIARKPRRVRRTGAVALETAVVMLWMATFVFAIFEYGRLMMDWSLLNNAAREGCRYALVNNTSPTIADDVKTLVTSYMATESTNFTSFAVTITGTHNGVATTANNLVAGDPLFVTASGVYKFLNIIPLFKMPTTFTISGSCMMICEGTT